jgi:hypothetical protein
MNMEMTTILDDCLARLQAGASIADCLAQHPEAATELAPMLAAASQLSRLAVPTLSDAQRLRGKVALREAHSARPAPRTLASWLGGARPLRGWAMAVVAACVLFASVAAGAVAASQPGDLTYSVRVTVERAPALLSRDPAQRAAAELAAADRRLADLHRASARPQPAVDVALEALIAGDEAVADETPRLSEPARLRAAERVEGHAVVLARLAVTAPEARAAEALAAAATRASAIAAHVRAGQPNTPPGGGPPIAPPGGGLPSATPSTARPAETPTPTRSPLATPTATVGAPEATPTDPATPTHDATRPGSTSTRTPDRRPTDGAFGPPTGQAPRPTETPARRATGIAATLTALPSRSVQPATATRSIEQTLTPGRPTGTPPPAIETRRAEHTVMPERRTPAAPNTPLPPPATPVSGATGAPQPTPGGGPQPTAPGPDPGPRPTRGGRLGS